ncbi:tetratricopeptide repeat protein [Streptomyces sp. NPDC048258]|uniref:tetratricopeptide repeat protein n=1 Tax=Streptomyces sp. NPDC048258 TaxID=3365527 RepID=UPI003717F75F
MNLTGHAVEVLRRRPGGVGGSVWTVGSGYAVGASYVLTAAHNVMTGPAPDEEVLVRRLDHREYRATVVAAGPPGGPDIAVLDVAAEDFPRPPFTVGFARIDRSGIGPVPDCWAMGFPGFNTHPAHAPDLPRLRDSVEVYGSVLPGFHIRRGLLHLATGATPPAPPAGSARRSQWQGMSGAVVFVQDPVHGPLAVGVISGHHGPEGPSSLTVVPVTELAALDDSRSSRWWRQLGLGTWVTIRPRSPSGPARPATPTGGRLALGRPSAHFTDREQEAAEATALLTRELGESVPVVVLYGMGGVGKTTLARQLGHRLGSVFPYARVLVDLGGASEAAVSTDAAIVQLLGHLGVKPDRIPHEPDERRRELRRVLRQGPCLVVIDNAVSARQVEPLLPDAPGSAALVTSRSALTALEGADLLPLDPLPDDEGLRLFERMVGSRVVSRDREACRSIVSLVGGLPLAIRVTAAAAASPTLRRRPLSVLADRLAGNRASLLGLRSGDTGLRSSFDLSYQLLREETQGFFRCLGLLPGADFSAEAAAGATELSARHAEELLAELADQHLVEVRGEAVARYQLHDMLRLYARERAENEDPEAHRRATLRGAVRWYERSLAAWMSLPGAHERPPEDALAWYAQEHTNVQAGLRAAHESGEWDLVTALATSLYGLLAYRGRWEDLEAAKAWAVEAAREQRDRPAELGSLIHLAEARRLLGRTDGIAVLYERALEITTELGDDGRRGWVLTHYGDFACQLGRPEQGMLRYAQAGRIYDAQGDTAARIWLAAHISDAQLQSGRPDDAVRTQEEALRLSRGRDNPGEEAWCAWHLALAYDAAGRYPEAESTLGAAIAFHRSEQDRGALATMLVALGRVHEHSGRPELAREALQEALALVRSLDAPSREEEIRAELARLS